MDDDYEALILAIRLSKAGYGTPEQILQMDSMTVIVMCEYEKFDIDYQNAFMNLNKDE